MVILPPRARIDLNADPIMFSRLPDSTDNKLNLSHKDRRNAHIIYTAQTDYIGNYPHQVSMFDADNEGNLIRVGAIRAVWINLVSFLTFGEIKKSMNERVLKALKNTLSAIDTKLGEILTFVNKNPRYLDDPDNARKLTNKVYNMPEYYNSALQVMCEPFFLLNISKINVVYDPIAIYVNSRIQYRFAVLNKKIIQANSAKYANSLGMLSIMEIDKGDSKLHSKLTEMLEAVESRWLKS